MGDAGISAEPVARVVAIVGPTAAGKSELGIAVARACGGEVVNVDAMQLYRGMDIGTAKLSLAERAEVPHHLLDIWDVSHRASVAEYQQVARATITRLAVAGRPAVFVGGSGLYLRATLDHLALPGTDPAIRDRWESELDRVGPVALHAELARRDPAAAAAILSSNGRRIVRALEVIELTGHFTAQLPPAQAAYHTVYLGLDRSDLDDRVAARVAAMWQAGLVAEVRALEQQGLRDGPTASRAVGYRQVLAWFSGDSTEAEAIERTAQQTRRLARRQRSWFRRDDRITWLNAADSDVAEQAIRLIDARWR